MYLNRLCVLSSHSNFFSRTKSYISKGRLSTLYGPSADNFNLKKRTFNSSLFFEATSQLINKNDTLSCLNFLKSEATLKETFYKMGIFPNEDYIYRHFSIWLSRYAENNFLNIQAYFLGEKNLNWICNDFIRFCFREGILLNKEKTLGSFKKHNEASDAAIKNELMKMKPKTVVNLLGFGLDEGEYEKTLVEYIIKVGLAKDVRLFGFDPFAKEAEGIKYLRAEQLSFPDVNFDIITARWVLHHVNLSERWTDLIRCINSCNPEALILIVEHGFLKEKRPAMDVKLYTFLNATFDVLANIGIRPQWFTATWPNVGSNFFIHYLKPADFTTLQTKTVWTSTQRITDVGPAFPNQTVCSMRTCTPKCA